MLTFLHAADFHLDSPFAGLSPRDASAARDEQRARLDELRHIAATKRVDLVFLPGDLFDGAHCYPESIDALGEALGSIHAAIFISPGNHDPYGKNSPYRTVNWPSHVHIFTQETVEAVPLPELGCTVYGSAFCQSVRQTSPLVGLNIQGDGLHLGCFHGDLGKTSSHYAPLPLEELARSGLHYAALGHIHARTPLQTAGETQYAYCGCLQGRGFDETGEKGLYVGTVTDDGIVSLEFHKLGGRQYRNITVRLDGSQDGVTALQAILQEEAGRDIVRICFRGRRQEEFLALDILERLCAPYFYSVTLLDESERPRDPWERVGEEGLCGSFLRGLKARFDLAEPAEQDTILLAATFGLAALEGREEPRP